MFRLLVGSPLHDRRVYGFQLSDQESCFPFGSDLTERFDSVDLQGHDGNLPNDLKQGVYVLPVREGLDRVSCGGQITRESSMPDGFSIYGTTLYEAVL